MYVFDDANHDGITDVTERVLQLKTSKIKMVESQAIEYKRGQSGSTGPQVIATPIILAGSLQVRSASDFLR